MQPLHTVLLPDQNLANAIESFRYDLPVNPLSVVIVTLRALNNAAAPANVAASAMELMSKIGNVRSRYRGATIFDGAPVDLVQVFGRYSKWWPIQGQINGVDDDVRSVSFPLLFGRRPYDPMECFPATRRGDLTLEIDTIADPTGLDGFDMQIETVELLDATPERFIKVTTSQQTLAAGDVNDVVLPIGNKLLGLMLRANRVPNGASNDASFNECALELDNVEVMYSRTFWRGLHAEWARRARLDWMMSGHQHTIRGSGAAAAAYAQATASGIAADANNTSITTGTAARSGITGIMPETERDALQMYGFADFDPMDDLSMGIDTGGAADINWHVNASVADAAASRILPIELVVTGGAGTPAQ